MRRLMMQIVAAAAAMMASMPAKAAIDIFVYEDGDDLVTAVLGTFNTAALSAGASQDFGSVGVFLLQGTGLNFGIYNSPVDRYFGRASVSGDFSAPLETLEVSGSSFGFILGRVADIWVPQGYRSGDIINATAIYRGVSLTSASIDTGTFTIDVFDSNPASGALADRVTFRIGETPPVPEPATWAMMIVGFGLVGAAMRRRRETSSISYA